MSPRSRHQHKRTPFPGGDLQAAQELGNRLDDLIFPNDTDVEVLASSSTSARLPCPGPPSRAIVPVTAHAAAHVVSAPSSSSSCRDVSASSSTSSTPVGRQTLVEVWRDPDPPSRPVAAKHSRQRRLQRPRCAARWLAIVTHAVGERIDDTRIRRRDPPDIAQRDGTGAAPATACRTRPRTTSRAVTRPHHSRNISEGTAGKSRLRPHARNGPGGERRSSPPARSASGEDCARRCCPLIRGARPKGAPEQLQARFPPGPARFAATIFARS